MSRKKKTNSSWKESTDKKSPSCMAVEQLIVEGQFEKALAEIDEIIETEAEIKNQLDLMVLKSRCFTQLGQFENTIVTAQEVVKTCTESRCYPHILIDAIIPLVEALWRLGRYDECLTTIEQGEDVIQETSKEQNHTCYRTS